MPFWASCGGAAALLAALWLARRGADRRELERYEFTTAGVSDEIVTLEAPGAAAAGLAGGLPVGWLGTGAASNINPLAPETLRSLLKMITGLLLGGPDWVCDGWGMLRRGVRPPPLDECGAPELLRLLLVRPRRVSFAELEAERPDLDAPRIAGPLAEMGIVRILPGNPPGLALSDRARRELLERLPGQGFTIPGGRESLAP